VFSVIMPTYNCAKYVAEAVQSVLAQTYSDFELIIVDDGSTDGTFESLQTICKQNNRIRLHQIPHAGVSAARNYGIEKAVGDKILFMDGDDSWEENLLESCNEAKQLDLIVFGIRPYYYDDEGVLVKTNASMSLKPTPKELTWTDTIDFIFPECNMSSPCNKVYNRELIEKKNVRFSTDCVYLEDLKFNLDYLKHINSLYIVNKDLYKYRLFFTQNQTLKRKFKGFFLNADEISISAEKLLNSLKSNFARHPTLVSILLKAYYQEFCGHIYEQDKAYVKEVLKKLNSNLYYNRLLSLSKGRFFKILKIFTRLGCKSLQIKTIKRRYFNG